MQEKMTGNEYRTAMVCIDSYESSIPVGRLFNPYLSGGPPFASLMQLLLQMEDLLDTLHFPQPFSELRTFATPPPCRPQAETETTVPRGALATFAVKVLFRQNASWQGSVTWLDRGQEESFRSVLELLLLMDNALKSGA